MAQKITVGGLDAVEVYENVISAGVTKDVASRFIGEWLIDKYARLGHTFDYATVFPAVDEHCVPHFVRSFQHQDWQDGEDLVQAEQGAGEDGFNFRFHRIEDDLDALFADVAEAFLCLSELRAKARAMFDEVRIELNRINQLLDSRPPVASGFGEIEPPKKAYTGPYLGEVELTGKPYNVYVDDSGGLFLAPTVKVTKGGGYTDPAERVGRASAFARYATETKRVQDAFGGGPVTKGQLMDLVKDDVTADGRPVSDLVDILPSTAKFTTVDELTDTINELEAASLRTSNLGDAAVAGALGVENRTTETAKAPVAAFQPVPEEARAVLVASGVNSLSDLAALNPTDLSKTLKKGGVSAGVGEAAGWIAAAKTISAIMG
jgi:hypothetical protein